MNRCIIDGCDSPVEGNTSLCATHNFEQRKAEKNAAKVKIQKPVNKVSESRADELKLYPKKKKAFLLHKMACEVKLQGCTLTATDIHHCSTSGKDFLNEDTWTAVCRSCHVIIETKMSAEERRSKGLLI